MNEALTQSIEQWLTSTNRFPFRLFSILHAASDVRTVYNTTQAAHLPATPPPPSVSPPPFCMPRDVRAGIDECRYVWFYKNIFITHNSYVLNENKGFPRVRSSDCRSWEDANTIRISTFDFFNTRNTILLCKIN